METTLSHFTKVQLKTQKACQATGSHITHLQKQGRKVDARILEIHKKEGDLEKLAEKYIAEDFKAHPTYLWTSRIMGCGLEAAPKVIGKIEGVTFRNALFLDLKDAGIVETLQELKDHWASLESAYFSMFQRRSSIYAFDTPSRLRRFAGLAPIDGKTEKVTKGQKGLHYSPELRMLLWRLLTRLLQQVDYHCPKCGVTVKKDAVLCEGKGKHCGAKIEGKIVKVYGVWYKKYLENDAYYMARFKRDGIKVIPTPAGRFCPVCLVEKEVSKTTKNCPDCGEKLMAKNEPPGVIFRGHVVNMAKRRTIRLWLDCLWIVWRQAEGLSTRPPWVLEHGEHQTLIDPWAMVDK